MSPLVLCASIAVASPPLRAERPDDAARAVKTLEGVAADLEALGQHYSRTEDPRAAFTLVYARLTGRIAEKVRSQPRYFRDPRWIAHLSEEFAREYARVNEPVSAWLQRNGAAPGINPLSWMQADDSEIPAEWQHALSSVFDTRMGPELAFYPMLAHVRHDMLRVLSSEPGLEARSSDYQRMNELMGDTREMIDLVAKFDPKIRLVPGLSSFARGTIVALRDEVFSTALELQRSSPRAREVLTRQFRQGTIDQIARIRRLDVVPMGRQISAVARSVVGRRRSTSPRAPSRRRPGPPPATTAGFFWEVAREAAGTWREGRARPRGGGAGSTQFRADRPPEAQLRLARRGRAR
jgi:hypothetical protein